MLEVLRFNIMEYITANFQEANSHQNFGITKI